MLMPDRQRGTERTTGVTRCRLHPDAIELAGFQ